MKLDERGKQCPLPVIETKKALERSVPGTVIEVMVDNEIAVQNLLKMELSTSSGLMTPVISDSASIRPCISKARISGGSL